MDTGLLFSRRHDSDSSSAKIRVSSPILFIVFRSQSEQGVEFPVDRLVFNTAELDESMTVEQAGLETESSIDTLVTLDGGKRKRNKKVYTKMVKRRNKRRPSSS